MKRLAGIVVFFLLLVLSNVLLFSAPALASEEELAEIRDAIRSKGAGWVADETSVSILPPEQRRAMLGAQKPVLTGVEPLSPRGGRSALPALATATPPSAFDWRNSSGNNFVTPVRNQGGCGSCWAFATTAALESYVLITQNTPGTDVNLSEQVLVSCNPSIGNCGGGYVGAAADYIKNTGLPLETCFPYTAKDSTTGTPCSNACSSYRTTTYKIYAWYYVATFAPTVSAIKSSLCTYGPLVTTMDVYADFYNYRSGVYSYVSGAYQGGHAILIVGYDDAGGYFVVKNSWGGGWGESGYFRIAYSELNSVVQFGDYTIAYEAPTSDTTPDPFVFTDQTGVALSTVVTSNTITVGGINAAAPVSITGGTYSINGTAYTSASGTVNNGNTVAVRVTSSGSYSTMVNATLTIGGVSDTFSVTTQNPPATPGTIQFSSANYSFNENGGIATITVTRTGGSNGAVGVSYSTSNGTATAGSDYTATSGILNWASGDTGNKTFSVPILDDSIYEGSETVNLSLNGPTGGATLGGPSTAVLTLLENDPAPTGTLHKLRLVTETGETITSSTEIISHYFISSEDGTLNMIVNEPLGFIPTYPDIRIYSVSGGNCILSGDGGVEANAEQTFSFNVRSSTPGATLSALYLPINYSGVQATLGSSGTFQWSTTSNDIGSYLAEFQASIGGLVSRVVVLIDIVP